MENEINGYKWAMCTTMEIIGCTAERLFGLIIQAYFQALSSPLFVLSLFIKEAQK